MPHESEVSRGQAPSERLLSLDALRGFDMFWIIGGEELAKALATWGNWPIKDQVQEQLDHVPWEGFHFYDLIFPLFLFLVGVVLPFSLGKLQERGEPRSRLYWRVLRRTVLLFALGLVYYGILQLRPVAEQRFVGVLQRIALCYGCAAVILLNTRVRGQVLITAILLLGYWALLAWVPAPDVSAEALAKGANASGQLDPRYAKETNLSGYIDRHYLPGKIFKDYYEFGDNEGILSTIPALATALLGVLAGQWLRSKWSPWLKVLGLVVAGLVCLGVGTLWGQWFPIVKNIWTSSFVLVAGGWSLLLLALFYLVIDVLRFRAWAFFFVVIGVNAITIYVGEKFIDFHKMAHFFLGGVAEHVAADFRPVLLWAGVLAIEWLFLLYLYRKRTFLRV